jgi:hypothetical protein
MIRIIVARVARREERHKFKMDSFEEIPDLVDIVFGPDPSPDAARDCGWLEVVANEEGRGAIRRMFPNTELPWYPHPWEGWQWSLTHWPTLAAIKANTLPHDLVRQEPLQELSDNELSVLLAIGATNQGVRSAQIAIDENELTLNLVEGASENNPNVLNMPTVRPLDPRNPREALLHEMTIKADNNMGIEGCIITAIERIFDGSDLVFALFPDASQPGGLGYLVVKGEDLWKNTGQTAGGTANAFFCDCYEMALAVKALLENEEQNDEF